MSSPGNKSIFRIEETSYGDTPSKTPTGLPAPGLPFSRVFRAEPGREDVILRVASAYEAASRRRIMPPALACSTTEPRIAKPDNGQRQGSPIAVSEPTVVPYA